MSSKNVTSIVKEIPVGPTGKLQRIELAQKLGLAWARLETRCLITCFVVPAVYSRAGAPWSAN